MPKNLNIVEIGFTDSEFETLKEYASQRNLRPAELIYKNTLEILLIFLHGRSAGMKQGHEETLEAIKSFGKV